MSAPLLPPMAPPITASPHAAEFCAIASVNSIVVVTVARIREGKVHRIDHTLIVVSCVLFRFKGNGSSDGQGLILDWILEVSPIGENP